MAVMVLSKVGHALSHSVFGSSLAGDGLLVRIRSTSIALFGLVTAIGLGLVVFISQQGWPGAFNSAIPSNPPELGVVHDAVALTHPAPAGSSPKAALVARPAVPALARGAGRGSHASGGSGIPGGSGIHRAHQVEGTPSAPPSHTPTPQPSAPVSEPAGQPAATSPAPTATVVSSPTPGPANQPHDSSSSQSKSTASSPATVKSSGSGQDKAGSHSGSKGVQTGKANGTSAPAPTPAPASKPKSSSHGKSAESHGTPAPPPAEPGSKEAPAVPGDAGHGNGKSGKGDH
jgi:hypothetical protein